MGSGSANNSYFRLARHPEQLITSCMQTLLIAVRRDQITSGWPTIQQLAVTRDSGSRFPKIIPCAQKTFRQLD